jgi:DNA gyrase subunit B
MADTESEDIIRSIRKRPGMYVGDVHDGSGILHLLWEVVGNALDEHLAGHCRRIAVTLNEDDSVTVEDDGRGIPVGPTPDGTPFLEAVLCRMHDRATFDGHPKHVHLDAGGLGLVVVNGTCHRVVVESAREGRLYRQEFRAGPPAGPLVDLGETDRRGTRLTFAPDPAIFTNLDLDATRIRLRLRELSAFCPGVTLRFEDRRRSVIASPNGLLDLLAHERRGFSILPEQPIHAATEQGGVRVEIALQWSRRYGGHLRSFVNLHETHEGGTHVTGLRRALNELLADLPAPKRRTIAETLDRRAVGILSVHHHDPQFEGPTRAKLANPEVRPVVEAFVRRCLREFTERRPEEARQIVESARKRA